MKCSRREERVVEVLPQVGREDRDAVVLLHPLQQVGDLDVGVAVVRVLRTSERLPNSASASSKNSIAFAVSAAAKMRSRFFSVSPMYLLTTVAQVDLVEVEAELAGDDLGGHRLAGARATGEQRAHALAEGEHPLEAPLAEHLPALRDAIADVTELFECIGREDQVVPLIRRPHLAGERRERAPE